MVKAIDVEQRDVHVDLTLAAISGSFLHQEVATRRMEMDSKVTCV